jgi:hypothetical protein
MHATNGTMADVCISLQEKQKNLINGYVTSALKKVIAPKLFFASNLGFWLL